VSRIRLGLIGCGGMAKATYVDALERLTDQATLAAAVDLDIDRARHAAQAFPEAKVATDYREVLDEVDGVMLVLPHHLHHPIGMDCLAAGKHVMMEKPLANTERECLDLIEASERLGRVLMVGYTMRYNPLVNRFKELLDEKAYGECFHISIWTEQYTNYGPDHWSASAEKLGGGQLFSHGCHYIDLLMWFLGRPVSGTHVGTNYGTPWMEKEGTSNVCLRFQSGATAYHFGTWGAAGGSRLKYSFHAHCTGGMLELQHTLGKLIAHVGGKEHLLAQAETGQRRPGDIITDADMDQQPIQRKRLDLEIAHFLECIRTGKPPRTTARESLQGLRVIWRLYRAEEEGVVADLRGLGLDECR